MSELARDRCPDCGRIYYELGAEHMIEAAKVSDGRSPADEYLASLESSRKPKDIDRLANILIRFEAYAYRGVLEVPRELNDLRDGIREIKAGDVRLPFFHLEGSPAGAIRLTHGFLKKQRWTPKREINKAIWVRREDLTS